MKKLFLESVVTLLGGLQLQAGNILVTNYNEDIYVQLPISLRSGASLLKGGAVPIAANIQLVDQSIYTMIGDAAALGTSYPFAIMRHNSALATYAPVFADVADISFAGSVVLMGCFRGPSITPGLGAPPSLRMGIPEAMSVSLLFASKAFMARHRRMEWF
jgi:hypothetical protein